MDNRYAELENIRKDRQLRGEIVAQAITHWRFLNLRQYFQEDAALEYFINDEKGKVDFVSRIQKEVGQLKGKHILDVGCGKGGVVISCACQGAEAIGVDVDSQEIEIAKLRLKSFGVVNAQVIQGDAESIQFSDNSFDVVIATSVLEHVRDLSRVIEEIVRVTKKGGMFCLAIPNPRYPREAHYKVIYPPYLSHILGGVYLRLLGLNPGYFIESVNYPYPSILTVKRLLERNGLKVYNITERDLLNKFITPTSIETVWIRNIIKFLKVLRLNKLLGNAYVRLYLYPGAFIVGAKS